VYQEIFSDSKAENSAIYFVTTFDLGVSELRVTVHNAR
jgi:hypothetical protein